MQDLINNSVESILEKYSYSGGRINIMLNLISIEKIININIKTDHLSFDSFYLEKDEELYRTCRIDIQTLIDVLSIKNGIFIPPDTFEKLMKESRSNFNLAYGKKASDIKYIFSLVGYGKLISCLIKDLSCIKILE